MIGPARPMMPPAASISCLLQSSAITTDAAIPPSCQLRVTSAPIPVSAAAIRSATTSGRNAAYGLTAASNHAVRTMAAARSSGCHGNRPARFTLPPSTPDEAAGVSLRSGGVSSRLPRGSRKRWTTREIWVRKKNGMASAVASTAWMTMLPAPGSM